MPKKKIPNADAPPIVPTIAVPLADRLSWSPEQVAAMTGIGVSRIREAISDGPLAAHKNGASIRILPDDVKLWLKSLPEVETKRDRPS